MINSFFNNLVKKLIELEGGYVFNPSDKGGETKYGISKHSYPHLDIKNLTEEQAIDIYNKDFWHKNNLHKIEDYELAWALFKAVVVTNAPRVISILQSQYNALGHPFLEIDGRLGEKTAKSINALDKRETNVLTYLVEYSLAKYYTTIVIKNDSQRIFLIGWLNRLFFK